jgi:hypothetical protein
VTWSLNTRPTCIENPRAYTSRRIEGHSRDYYRADLVLEAGCALIQVSRNFAVPTVKGPDDGRTLFRDRAAVRGVVESASFLWLAALLDVAIVGATPWGSLCFRQFAGHKQLGDRQFAGRVKLGSPHFHAIHAVQNDPLSIEEPHDQS